MRVLITGAGGQLGYELQRSCPAEVELHCLDRAALDITLPEAVLDQVAAAAPDLVINAAAYTAVDGAETKPDLAVAVNAEGPGLLARAAAGAGARLIHVSTDFVFDGSAQQAYGPRDETRPLGVYGHSKLAGECRVREVLPHSTVVRTSWLYSAHGANFVKTMLKLMAERDALRVVDDQVGAPTWAYGLAQALWGFAGNDSAHGIYHWTDAGSCSWYEFACAIQQLGLELGLLGREIPIEAISTAEYPTPAQRPAFSVLDCSAAEAALERQRLPWRDQLHAMLQELLDVE